jgi:hypothetical protein
MFGGRKIYPDSIKTTISNSNLAQIGSESAKSVGQSPGNAGGENLTFFWCCGFPFGATFPRLGQVKFGQK